MNKIYTRTGDLEHTSLGDGTRVKKTSLQIEVSGNIDELIAYIEHLKVKSLYHELLNKVIGGLYEIGKDVSCKPHKAEDFMSSSVQELEDLIDKFGSKFEGFVSPTNEISSRCNLCRVVSRKLERSYLKWEESLYPEQRNIQIQKYLNRLSDLFYTLMIKFN